MLLKNGIIYDGTLNASFQGSILYENDKIVKISANPDDFKEYQGEVIDCTGLCISPGFIDAHSHNDFFAGYESNMKYFSPFILQGITTMIGGNCGFSAAGYSENSPYVPNIGSGLFSNRGQDYSNFAKWGA